MRKILVAACLAALAAPAFASSGFAVRGGFANVNPKSDNGTLAGAAASVDSDTQALLGASYFFDNGLELTLDLSAQKHEHTVTLAGLGTVVALEHQPITFGANWHFLGRETGGFSPYAGLGYSRVAVSNVRGINALSGAFVDVDDANGPSVALGADFVGGERWFLRGEARWIDFDSEATLNGAAIGTANVDPWVFSLQAGLRF